MQPALHDESVVWIPELAGIFDYGMCFTSPSYSTPKHGSIEKAPVGLCLIDSFVLIIIAIWDSVHFLPRPFCLLLLFYIYLFPETICCRSFTVSPSTMGTAWGTPQGKGQHTRRGAGRAQQGKKAAEGCYLLLCAKRITHSSQKHPGRAASGFDT